MGAFHLEIKKKIENILNKALLTKIIAHKKSLTMGSKHKHHIQLLGNDANE